VFRADLVGALDSLTPPRLPRPARSFPSLYEMLRPKDRLDNELIRALVGRSVNVELVSVFIDLSRLCAALDYAVAHGVTVHPQAFDEDTTCIQHDLLRILPRNSTGIEGACTLAALVFIQTFTKEAPFSGADTSANAFVAQRLRASLESSTTEEGGEPLIFWIYLIGAMASQQTSEEGWFRQKLCRLRTEYLPISTWTFAEDGLKKILWSPTIHSTIGQRVWEDQLNSLIPVGL